MKKRSFLLVLISVIIWLCVCSCDNNATVVIKDDGTTSNGSIFSAIDDKNFFLDYVKYTVEEGHLAVSGYDMVGFKGVAKIASIITYKGNTYEVLSIGEEAFAECITLTSIILSNSVTSIGEDAFRCCTGLTSIDIPNSVTNVGVGAFCGCIELKSIEIPNSVTVINSQAFLNCTGLTSIETPNSLKSIGDMAFGYCTGLTSIKIPNSVTSIGDLAFQDCAGLTSIEIPNSVTSFGFLAFSGCTGLKSLTVHNNRPPVADSDLASQDVYDNCVLYVPEESGNAYYVADGWKNFKTIKTIDAIEKVP